MGKITIEFAIKKKQNVGLKKFQIQQEKENSENFKCFWGFFL